MKEYKIIKVEDECVDCPYFELTERYKLCHHPVFSKAKKISWDDRTFPKWCPLDFETWSCPYIEEDVYEYICKGCGSYKDCEVRKEFRKNRYYP